MYFYFSPTTDPYFNIATEEYFLKHPAEDFFFLYVNRPSVIVGKHQNTMAEINVPYVMEQNIPVIRRLSGGGTVFHDLGNLNFCFIQSGKPGYLVDFKKFSQPILNVLQKLEINAWLRGKSDLVIDNLKFSGNAEHVYKNRVLHHGTLLFSSELSMLTEAIKADWGKFTDKAVRSNRSEVTNISYHLKKPLTLEAFSQMLSNEVKRQQDETSEFEMQPAGFEAIDQLVNQKYGTWEWNFSYSPDYEFNRTLKLNSCILKTRFRVEKGIIQNIACVFAEQRQSGIEESLTFVRHEYYPVKEKLGLFIAKNRHINLTLEELLSAFF